MGYNIAGLVVNKNFDRNVQQLATALRWGIEIIDEITFEQATANWLPEGEFRLYFSDKATMIFFPHEWSVEGYHVQGAKSLCYAYSATAMVFVVDYLDENGTARYFMENEGKKSLENGAPLPYEQQFPTASGLIFKLFDELLGESFHAINFADKAYRCRKIAYKEKDNAPYKNALFTETVAKEEKKAQTFQEEPKITRLFVKRAGVDILADLELTLEECYKGVTKNLLYSRKKQCTACNNPKNCSTCSGKGYVLEEHTEAVNFPAGIDDEMTIKIKNKGNWFPAKHSIWTYWKIKLQKTAPTYGDLVLAISLRKHKHFQRNGQNLICEYTLPKVEVMARDVVIQLADLDKNTLKIKIPQGTENGKVFQIKGKGFRNIKDNKVGNLLIIIKLI
ncbi:MAG: DnaJ C-terminal domain-containing protein [Chitinophagales bacterium]|nr:J domain-containing protein [Bacteroidota bacterium]MCB9042179.1 J domain-containing protein [Chitinophagales bacterium]